ncbi:uncharacterized protein si:zfos-1056e6.1 isoform X2 [Kryptolebias marmoratus]|nr:uncharacterized protein si:zfos-1056e6.1 isoform X2 [Kryptolebias marmoratus]
MIAHAFGLSSLGVVLKIRNHRGRLIPLNSSIPANSKHRPHVLEVTRFFQHLHPKPRTVPVAVINSSMKTRLQAVDHRVQRLDDLLPQVKLQHDDRLTQELRSLDLKLKFLYRRMEVADSHSWKGMLSRAPLW